MSHVHLRRMCILLLFGSFLYIWHLLYLVGLLCFFNPLFLYFYLVLLSAIENRVLKYPSSIAEQYISLFFSVHVCLIYFDGLYYVHKWLYLKLLLGWNFYWVWLLGWEDPLQKGMATHSSILAWRISWAEEPSGLQVHVVAESNMTEWLTLSLHYTSLQNLFLIEA